MSYASRLMQSKRKANTYINNYDHVNRFKSGMPFTFFTFPLSLSLSFCSFISIVLITFFSSFEHFCVFASPLCHKKRQDLKKNLLFKLTLFQKLLVFSFTFTMLQAQEEKEEKEEVEAVEVVKVEEERIS